MFGNPDELIDDAVKIIIQYNRVAASLLQRRLSIGYARASRIVDQLESLKLISESDGSSKPRKVLIKNFEEFEQIKIDLGIVNEETEPTQAKEKEIKPIPAMFLNGVYNNLSNESEMVFGIDEKGLKVSSLLSEMGNLIIVGNSISKKLEFLKTYIVSLISQFSNKKLKFLIFDFSHSLNVFNNVPHIISPITNDQDKLTSNLFWLSREIDRRISLKEKNELEYPRVVALLYLQSLDQLQEGLIYKIISLGNMVNVNLVLVVDNQKDLPRKVRENIPAKFIFNEFGEPEAVFSFKEKTKIKIDSLDIHEITQYLKNIEG